MTLQELSVKFPEPVQFPEGVDGEDLVLHLIAWYLYSSGNNESALKITGESPMELEKKLLELGFSRKWLSRLDSRAIQPRVEAMEMVKDSDTLAEQRVQEGWKEEDFKQDFLRVQKEIAEILKEKQDEKRK